MSDSGDSNEEIENSNPNPQQIAGGGDGESPNQSGSKSAASEIEIGSNVAASADQSVGKIAAASETLSSISTAGFLAARQRPPFSLPPLPLLPGQVYSSPGQPANAGGGVKSGTAPRAFSSSAIGKAEPPRGLDPKIHHRDAAANLAAVAESLRSSGLAPPKVLNQPQPKHSLNTVLSSATGPSGPVTAHLNGASEIRFELVTQSFLAAAADKLFSLLAEDLLDTISPVVPNIAACRGHWKSKFWAGSNILVLETPDSFKAEMSRWTIDGTRCNVQSTSDAAHDFKWDHVFTWLKVRKAHCFYLAPCL